MSQKSFDSVSGVVEPTRTSLAGLGAPPDSSEALEIGLVIIVQCFCLLCIDDVSYFLFPFHELSANRQIQNRTIENAFIVAQANERVL